MTVTLRVGGRERSEFRSGASTDRELRRRQNKNPTARTSRVRASAERSPRTGTREARQAKLKRNETLSPGQH